MREQDRAAGSSGRPFVTKPLSLAIYKQRAYILALENSDQVGYMKMKKGLAFFL